MKDFIQNMKAKPEHIRKRIALGTSVGITALVGVLWFTTMATTGAFALTGSGDPADNQPKEAAVALTNTNVKSSFAQLMGAVGAAATGSSSKPTITIVDGETSSSLNTPKPTNTTSATVIPF